MSSDSLSNPRHEAKLDMLQRGLKPKCHSRFTWKRDQLQLRWTHVA